MSRPLPLSTLLAVVGIEADSALAVGGIALDTRELRAGDVFVALRGQREHGLKHLDTAIARGAVAVLAELPLPSDLALPTQLPAFAVADLRPRLGALADFAYERPSAALKVIGVTGTNGKTSTVQFIAQAAARSSLQPATQGTLGCGPLLALEPQERTTPAGRSAKAALMANTSPAPGTTGNSIAATARANPASRRTRCRPMR